jgi:hypothetical protein
MLPPSDLKTLQRLLVKAGSEAALRREIKRAEQLPKRGRGRPVREDNDVALLYFELVCRIFERIGVKRNTTLKMLVYQRPDNLYGKTAKAAVHRIAGRLRDPEFLEKFNEHNLCGLAKAYPAPFAWLKRMYDDRGDHKAEDREANQRAWADTFKKIIQAKRSD